MGDDCGSPPVAGSTQVTAFAARIAYSESAGRTRFKKFGHLAAVLFRRRIFDPNCAPKAHRIG